MSVWHVVVDQIERVALAHGKELRPRLEDSAFHFWVLLDHLGRKAAAISF